MEIRRIFRKYVITGIFVEENIMMEVMHAVSCVWLSLTKQMVLFHHISIRVEMREDRNDTPSAKFSS
jgi:hypothetical protein